MKYFIYLCLQVLGRQDGPPVVGGSPWGSSLIPNGLPSSLLLLFYPPVLPFPPQKILLRLPWDRLWWSHGTCRCRLAGRLYHMCGALKLGTGDFYWTEGGAGSLSRGLNGEQVDGGQWVVWGLQSLEAGRWVCICASGHPLLWSWQGLSLILWSSYIVTLNLRRLNVHFTLRTSGWTGDSGDGQFDLESVRWLLSGACCRADDQDRRDACRCSQRSDGWFGLEGWFCWRIHTLNSIDDSEAWSLKDNKTRINDLSHFFTVKHNLMQQSDNNLSETCAHRFAPSFKLAPLSHSPLFLLFKCQMPDRGLR